MFGISIYARKVQTIPYFDSFSTVILCVPIRKSVDSIEITFSLVCTDSPPSQITATPTTSFSFSDEYTTVTLEVTPQDALYIDAVDVWGTLRLLLRSPLDDETVPLGLVDPKTIYAVGAGE